MTHSLAGCRAKITRAHEHLEHLDGQIKQFLREKPDAVILEFQFEEDWYIGRAHIVHPIPQEVWGLTIGDCVHNARSALDHLMWSLTGFYAGEDSTDTATQFPIFKDWYGFVTSRILNERMKHLFWFVQAPIVRAQPYNGSHPMLEPLWLLHHLDIIDKHKFIPVTLFLPDGVAVSNLPTSRMVAHEFITAPVEEGTPLVKFKFIQNTPRLNASEMKMRGSLTLDVTFGPIAGHQFLLVRSVLNNALVSVEKIADDFDTLLRRHYGIPPSRG